MATTRGRDILVARDDVVASTRTTIHRVAAHVLARRRYEVSGRFGLRASPGGIVTPAFGDGPEIIRLVGGALARELGGKVTYQAIAGSTMRELAAFAGTDIDLEFSCGPDTPELGDVDTPVDLDGKAAGALADWYHFGWQVLDHVIAAQPRAAEPDVIQLWPEHFDVGTSLGLPGGSRVNLGASPGDGYVEQPYLYIGPWEPERPGDPDFWNVSFGAVTTRSELGGGPEAFESGAQFLHRGVQLLGG